MDKGHAGRQRSIAVVALLHVPGFRGVVHFTDLRQDQAPHYVTLAELQAAGF